MSGNKSVNIWRIIILSLFAVFACTFVAFGSFLLGRQLASQSASASLPEITVVTESSPPTPEFIPTVSPTATDPIPEAEQLPAETPMDVELELLAPRATPQEPLSRDSQLDEDDLRLFFEVWRLVARQFDGELPSQEELIHAAIAGSLDTLDDQYTRFIPPDAAVRMRQDLQGSFEGIGAFIRMTEEGYLEIVRPMAQYPASRAGILPGDIITHIDGAAVQGLSLDEAIARVRGPEGTIVVLTILRADVEEPFEIEVERARIEIAIVESEMLADDIGYVRLTSFTTNASQALREAIIQLMSQNPVGLIFDLRDNPGGYLDQSVAVADLFLPQGVVLYERNIHGLDEIFNSQDGEIAEGIPLVVLVNAGSASASEIVAGAIQDRGRGTLIGETTFGKGSVQQTHTLLDGSELRVTVARWYTPDDNTIDGTGITPDIEVLPSPIDLGGPDDTQLQRAIQYLRTGQ
jgi:carboxyl-terminal processing protease